MEDVNSNYAILLVCDMLHLARCFHCGIAYLGLNHGNNYNRPAKSGTQENRDTDHLWYYQFGSHVVDVAKRYLDVLKEFTMQRLFIKLYSSSVPCDAVTIPYCTP